MRGVVDEQPLRTQLPTSLFGPKEVYHLHCAVTAQNHPAGTPSTTGAPLLDVSHIPTDEVVGAPPRTDEKLARDGLLKPQKLQRRHAGRWNNSGEERCHGEYQHLKRNQGRFLTKTTRWSPIPECRLVCPDWDHAAVAPAQASHRAHDGANVLFGL